MKKHFSLHQFRMLTECPAKWHAYAREDWQLPPPSDEMRAGNLFEAVATGTQGEDADNMYVRGDRDKGLKKIFADAAQAGDEFARHDHTAPYVTGTYQHRLEGELFGVNWLGFVDVLQADRFIELKCLGNWRDQYDVAARRYKAWYWSYELQCSLYKHLLQQDVELCLSATPVLVAVNRGNGAVVPVEWVSIREPGVIIDEASQYRWQMPFVEIAEQLAECDARPCCDRGRWHRRHGSSVMQARSCTSIRG
jgi:hypothetical protein